MSTTVIYLSKMGGVIRKGPLVNGLSNCHTKRRTGACGRSHPSSGMTDIKIPGVESPGGAEIPYLAA